MMRQVKKAKRPAVSVQSMLQYCRTVEPAVRSNLVIAIGDLAFRFPNLLEPWTANMYEPLLDPDDGE